MSLLMKALEKAAKDRGETRQPPPATSVETAAGPAPAATSPAMELSLEPLQADTPAAASPAESATPRAAAKTRNDRIQARAATVMQATARPAAAPATARLRIRPAMALGLVAGLVALGFAIYVYLQITNPGMFIRQAPPPPKPLTPLGQAPAQTPIATGTVILPADPVAQTRAPEQSQTARAASPAPAPPPAAAPVRSAEPQRNSIQVSAGTAEPQLNPQLGQAYAALQSGKLDAARQLYSDAARSEPRNINALLGLAAIALQEGRSEEASRLYFNVLELEPRNAYAQTGLIAMMGRADPIAAETRLKQLIAREPQAALYFTLGNLYGDQSRWAEAQQAYFQAHQLESSNPDYAYNLAVGLEHVGQPKLAATFYQRAVDQARNKSRVGFNQAQAQDRIRQLAAQPQ